MGGILQVIAGTVSSTEEPDGIGTKAVSRRRCRYKALDDGEKHVGRDPESAAEHTTNFIS